MILGASVINNKAASRITARSVKNPLEFINVIHNHADNASYFTSGNLNRWDSIDISDLDLIDGDLLVMVMMYKNVSISVMTVSEWEVKESLVYFPIFTAGSATSQRLAICTYSKGDPTLLNVQMHSSNTALASSISVYQFRGGNLKNNYALGDNVGTGSGTPTVTISAIDYENTDLLIAAFAQQSGTSTTGWSGFTSGWTAYSLRTDVGSVSMSSGFAYKIVDPQGNSGTVSATKQSDGVAGSGRLYSITNFL